MKLSEGGGEGCLLARPWNDVIFQIENNSVGLGGLNHG